MMTSPVPTSQTDRYTFDEARSRNGTSTTARSFANVVLVAAGAAAAYVVLSNPRGRRIARRLVRMWLGASVPVYLLAEAGRAWVEAGRRA
jgi:hypothetical protein